MECDLSQPRIIFVFGNYLNEKLIYTLGFIATMSGRKERRTANPLNNVRSFKMKKLSPILGSFENNFHTDSDMVRGQNSSIETLEEEINPEMETIKTFHTPVKETYQISHSNSPVIIEGSKLGTFDNPFKRRSFPSVSKSKKKLKLDLEVNNTRQDYTFAKIVSPKESSSTFKHCPESLISTNRKSFKKSSLNFIEDAVLKKELQEKPPEIIKPSNIYDPDTLIRPVAGNSEPVKIESFVSPLKNKEIQIKIEDKEKFRCKTLSNSDNCKKSFTSPIYTSTTKIKRKKGGSQLSNLLNLHVNIYDSTVENLTDCLVLKQNQLPVPEKSKNLNTSTVGSPIVETKSKKLEYNAKERNSEVKKDMEVTPQQNKLKPDEFSPQKSSVIDNILGLTPPKPKPRNLRFSSQESSPFAKEIFTANQSKSLIFSKQESIVVEDIIISTPEKSHKPKPIEFPIQKPVVEDIAISTPKKIKPELGFSNQESMFTEEIVAATPPKYKSKVSKQESAIAEKKFPASPPKSKSKNPKFSNQEFIIGEEIVAATPPKPKHKIPKFSNQESTIDEEIVAATPPKPKAEIPKFSNQESTIGEEIVAATPRKPKSKMPKFANQKSTVGEEIVEATPPRPQPKTSKFSNEVTTIAEEIVAATPPKSKPKNRKFAVLESSVVVGTPQKPKQKSVKLIDEKFLHPTESIDHMSNLTEATSKGINTELKRDPISSQINLLKTCEMALIKEGKSQLIAVNPIDLLFPEFSALTLNRIEDANNKNETNKDLYPANAMETAEYNIPKTNKENSTKHLLKSQNLENVMFSQWFTPASQIINEPGISYKMNPEIVNSQKDGFPPPSNNFVDQDSPIKLDGPNLIQNVETPKKEQVLEEIDMFCSHHSSKSPSLDAISHNRITSSPENNFAIDFRSKVVPFIDDEIFKDDDSNPENMQVDDNIVDIFGSPVNERPIHIEYIKSPDDKGKHPNAELIDNNSFSEICYRNTETEHFVLPVEKKDDNNDTVISLGKSKRKAKSGTLLEKAYNIAMRIDTDATLFDYELKIGLRPSYGKFVSLPFKIISANYQERTVYLICSYFHTFGVEYFTVIADTTEKTTNNKFGIIHFPVTIMTNPLLKSYQILAGNHFQTIENPDITKRTVAQRTSKPMLSLKTELLHSTHLMRTLQSNLPNSLLDIALGQQLMPEITLEFTILHIFPSSIKTVHMLLVDNEGNFCILNVEEAHDFESIQKYIKNKNFKDGCVIKIKNFFISKKIKIDQNILSLLEHCYNNKDKNLACSNLFYLESFTDTWDIKIIGKNKKHTKIVMRADAVFSERGHVKRYKIIIDHIKKHDEAIFFDGREIKSNSNYSINTLSESENPYFLDGVFYNPDLKHFYCDQFTSAIYP